MNWVESLILWATFSTTCSTLDACESVSFFVSSAEAACESVADGSYTNGVHTVGLERRQTRLRYRRNSCDILRESMSKISRDAERNQQRAWVIWPFKFERISRHNFSLITSLWYCKFYEKCYNLSYMILFGLSFVEWNYHRFTGCV